MRTRIILLLIFTWGSYAFGQSDCKVSLPDISGTYIGDCRKGLAHGKGVAQGKDLYEGQFVKGLPEGNGTYTWEGRTSFYEGQWKDGMRDGKGKMVTVDTTITGYWKANHYVGKELISSYVINSVLGVSRSTFKKSISSLDGVKMRIMQGGMDNITIQDFSLAYDSGDEYRNGPIIGIQNVRFPLRVYVRYRTWNQLHSAQYDVFFDFSINEPGSWDVVITN